MARGDGWQCSCGHDNPPHGPNGYFCAKCKKKNTNPTMLCRCGHPYYNKESYDKDDAKNNRVGHGIRVDGRIICHVKGCECVMDIKSLPDKALEMVANYWGGESQRGNPGSLAIHAVCAACGHNNDICMNYKIGSPLSEPPPCPACSKYALCFSGAKLDFDSYDASKVCKESWPGPDSGVLYCKDCNILMTSAENHNKAHEVVKAVSVF